MLQTRVIPFLLVQEGRLVKTVRFKEPVYVGDPVNAIKIYNEKEVDELIIVDIGVSRDQQKRPPFELLRDIANECFMPLCYGGGVRTLEDIHTIFSLGIEKVVINSFAAENPSFIKKASEKFGSQSIVLSIDVKKTFTGKYTVRTYGGSQVVSHDVVEYAQQGEQLGAGEIVLNSIDRDGTWTGYDIELLQMVSRAVHVPVIACGGASCLDDFRKAVQEGGVSAVAAGSMVVFQGKGLGVLINFPTRNDLEKVLALP